VQKGAVKVQAKRTLERSKGKNIKEPELVAEKKVK